MKPICKWPDGCPNPVWSGGTDYCYGHEQKLKAEQRKAEQSSRPVGRPRTNPEKCSNEECQRPAEVKGLCKTCYQRVKRMFK